MTVGAAGEMNEGPPMQVRPLMRPQRSARSGRAQFGSLPLFSFAGDKARPTWFNWWWMRPETSWASWDPPRSPVPQEAGAFPFSLMPYGRIPRNNSAWPELPFCGSTLPHC